MKIYSSIKEYILHNNIDVALGAISLFFLGPMILGCLVFYLVNWAIK